MRRTALLVVLPSLVLAGCPAGSGRSTTSAPPVAVRAPVARGKLFLAPPSSDPYSGPPRNEAPVETRPSGLGVAELSSGSGATAEAGKTVTVDYQGWLPDGTTFESTRTKGPYTFELGAGEVIRGWDEGVAGMKVGGTRRLTVPSDLAYGHRRVGRVAPGATLVFDLELLEVR